MTQLNIKEYPHYVNESKFVSLASHSLAFLVLLFLYIGIYAVQKVWGLSEPVSVVAGFSLVTLTTYFLTDMIVKLIVKSTSAKLIVLDIESTYELFDRIRSRRGWNPELFQGRAVAHLGPNAYELGERIEDIELQCQKLSDGRGSLQLDILSRISTRVQAFLELENRPKDNLDDLLFGVNYNLKLVKRIQKIRLKEALSTEWLWCLNFLALSALLCSHISPYNHIFENIQQYFYPLLWFSIIGFSIKLIFLLERFLIRKFTERTDTHFDDLLVTVTRIILIGLILIFGLKYLSDSALFLYEAIKKLMLDNFSDAASKNIIVIFGGVLTTFVWRHFVVLFLRRWAKRTHQKYDDVFVEIVNSIGIFFIITFFIGLFVIHSELDEDTKKLLTPYAIGLGIFSAITAYACKEAVQNFFSGILLQIDKPFEIGDRLLLPSDEVCDVREYGMRSTTLYDVLGNTEISIPNSSLINMMITNISRPDSQLRIEVKVFIPINQDDESESGAIPHSKKVNGFSALTDIEKAEISLVYLSYFLNEISLSCVSGNNSMEPDWNESLSKNDPRPGRTRLPIDDSLLALKNQYPGVLDENISIIRKSTIPAINTARVLIGFDKLGLEKLRTQGFDGNHNREISAIRNSTKNDNKLETRILVSELNRASSNASINRWKNHAENIKNNHRNIQNLISIFGELQQEIYDLKG